MLFLIFHLGADRYALDASQVVEVLPLVSLDTLPNAPRGVVGMLGYRGEPVPVVDLCRLVTRRPAAERFTTRIIIVNHPDSHGKQRRLGMIAENVTEVIRRNEEDFQQSALGFNEPAYLGPLLLDSRGIVRRIHEDRVLPNEVRDTLYWEGVAA